MSNSVKIIGINYRGNMIMFTWKAMSRILMMLIALVMVYSLATKMHASTLSTLGLTSSIRTYTPPQCNLTPTTGWRALDWHNQVPSQRSAESLRAGSLLTDLILHVTGIEKPSVIKLLKETLTERSSEAGPLLTDLCDFASKYKCPACVDSRPLPKTALDPRIRLNHRGTWKGYQLPVISIINTGRLGNWMSEYATTLALKKIYNVSTVLSPKFSKEMHNLFKGISLPVVEEFEKSQWTDIRKDFKVKRSYQALELAAAGLLGPKKFLFSDFLFELKLINAFKEDVRRELTFQGSIHRKATARLQSFKNMAEFDDKDERMTAVGVHVRLTDYPRHMHTLFDIEDVTKPYDRYLRRAVDYFTTRHSNLMFVVTSDDISATKVIFQRLGLRNVFVSQGSPEEDMCLLTLCDHNIVTFGSYGFWAAYLGRGTTVYADLNDTTLEYPFTKRFYENGQIENFVPVFFW